MDRSRGRTSYFIHCHRNTEVIPGIAQDLYVVPRQPKVIGIKFGESF